MGIFTNMSAFPNEVLLTAKSALGKGEAWRSSLRPAPGDASERVSDHLGGTYAMHV